MILQRFDVVDPDALLQWLVGRQMRLEGGFQGRANKLVDACYSFWQGAIPALLQRIPASAFRDGRSACDNGEEGSLLYDQSLLQRYILLCSQQKEGGFNQARPGAAGVRSV